MNTLSAFRTLGPIDMRNLWRDSMLRWMLLAPLAMGLGIRVLLGLAKSNFPGLLVELPYLPLLLNSCLILLNAGLFGMLVGFLLLDERDDATLIALQTTPLSLNSYFVYRIGLPMLLSFLLTLVVVPLADVAPVALSDLLIAAILASFFTPLYALSFAVLAQNKVQGFALAKAAGGFIFPPIVAYFLPAIWQWPFYIFPSYWPLKLFWTLDTGQANVWLYFVVGVVYLALVNLLLLRRFNTILHR
ncbi:MAG: hypothetical protein DWQ07_04390 [Chloroflexi bacterium]|nr:MAG: hypothetical protein DWQ07_04390 [Chloroflexota bacterium]MBL1194672.1 hypothetical protein [Chloroflexota bacterium]NOH11963.1 hypothetical protein [Chloroflexota bacterium]